MPKLVILVLLLAACGADGPPETPAARDGLVISGQARAGVVLIR